MSTKWVGGSLRSIRQLCQCVFDGSRPHSPRLVLSPLSLPRTSHASRFAVMSSRMAACGQPPVSTATTRSLDRAPCFTCVHTRHATPHTMSQQIVPQQSTACQDRDRGRASMTRITDTREKSPSQSVNQSSGQLIN